MKIYLYILVALLCIAKVYGYYYINELKEEIDEFYDHKSDFILPHDSELHLRFDIIRNIAKKNPTFGMDASFLLNKIYDYRSDSFNLASASLLIGEANAHLSYDIFAGEIIKLDKIKELMIHPELKFTKYMDVFTQIYIEAIQKKFGNRDKRRDWKTVVESVKIVSSDSMKLNLTHFFYERGSADTLGINHDKMTWYVNDNEMKIDKIPFHYKGKRTKVAFTLINPYTGENQRYEKK